MPPSPDSPPEAVTSPPQQQPASPDLRRLASGCDWYGYLTLENLDAVHTRLCDLIGDGQRFTSVYTNQDFWAHRPPEIRTGRTGTVTVSDPSAGHPYISVNEDGWTYWLDTKARDQAEARALPEKHRPPYLRFERDRVEITDHAPAGNKIFQVYAIEEREL